MRSISKLGVLLLTLCLLLATAGLCFGADTTANSGPPDGKQPPQPPTAAQMKEDLSKRLEQLVTNKVITQKQKTTVLEYYGTLFAKINGQDPRKMMETFEQLKKSGQDPASLLVKDGILTKEQAVAVGKLFPPQPPKGQPGNGPGGNRPPPPPATSQRGRFEGRPVCEAGPMFFGADFARQGPRFMAAGNGQEGGGRLMPPPPPPGKMGMMELIRERLRVLTVAKIITEQQAESILKTCRNFGVEGRHGRPEFDQGRQQLGEEARELPGMNNPPPTQTVNDMAKPKESDSQGQPGPKAPQPFRKFPELLAQMAKDGVITQEQVDILTKVLDLPPARQRRR